MRRQVDAIQWGGVVAEFFRRLSKSRRDSVEGGVVADFFRGLSQKQTRFSRGGGVVAECFVNGALFHF